MVISVMFSNYLSNYQNFTGIKEIFSPFPGNEPFGQKRVAGSKKACANVKTTEKEGEEKKIGFHDQGNATAFISGYLPMTQKSGILKSGGFAFKKQTVSPRFDPP